ncbi:MAG: ATP-binding protein [Bryobacteraceae bacterium]
MSSWSSGWPGAEALQRSNEDLQQFAYVASHDLKEPMRMISSYSTLLQRRYHDKLDNDANLYIDFVIDGVRRMNVLITDLLDYSRAGELPLGSLPPVDANASVQDALTNLTATVAESQAKVTIDSLPKVAYDPARLTQVFQNLIGNALKYRGDRAPVIRIGAARTGSGIVFSVQDNGIGIEARHTEEIFGIFKRLHSSKDYEGTGIGLALTKKIVERHGGRIWVESEFGVGSTFYFDVPNWGAATSQTANS